MNIVPVFLHHQKYQQHRDDQFAHIYKVQSFLNIENQYIFDIKDSIALKMF